MGQSLAKVSLVATAATLMQHFTFKLADEVTTHSTLKSCQHHIGANLSPAHLACYM